MKELIMYLWILLLLCGLAVSSAAATMNSTKWMLIGFTPMALTIVAAFIMRNKNRT